MNILVVGVVENDQLKRLQEEGSKQGHKVTGCYTSELLIKVDNYAFEPVLRSGKNLKEFDLIYLWALGKRRWEWYTAALYLSETQKTKIVYSKVVDKGYNLYLTPAIDYLKQEVNGLKFPKSAVIFDEKAFPEAVKGFTFPVILKKSEGRQGRGVFKVDSEKELVEIIKSLKEESPSFVIREFIPNDGDVRIFTIGFKAIGAMKRTPKEGDFRSNISQGGSGEVFDLEKYPKVREIAEKLSEVTRTEIAGVDIMLHKETGEPYILEINPGPQFLGIEKFTGLNVAGKIIEYFESLVK